MECRGIKKTGGRDEDNNVIGDNIPEEYRETVQRVKEFVNRSEQEIYPMLVECDMDANEASNRLLSQEPFQEVKSKRGQKKETKDKLDSQCEGDSSSIPDGESGNGGDYIVGGDKFKAEEEMSNVESRKLAKSSSEALSTTSNSDLTNVETKRVTISNSDVETILSKKQKTNVKTKRVLVIVSSEVPPPSLRYQPGNITMADVLKKSLGLLKEKPDVPETPPFKDEKPDETPSFKDEKPDVPETPSFKNEKPDIPETPPFKNEKPDVPNPFSNLREDHLANQLPSEDSLFYDKNIYRNDETYQLQSEDISDNLSLRHYSTRDVANPRMAAYETQSSVAANEDFTFDNSQRSFLQGLNIENLPFNHPMPTSTTASSLGGRKPSISMAEALKTSTSFVPQKKQQAMNHNYSKPKVPSGNYPPSAIQQHYGASNNNNTLPSRLPQYTNTHLTQSAHGSAYGFGTASDSRFGYDNVLHSQPNRSNQLASFEHQNANSNVRPLQGRNDSRVQSGSDYYSLLLGQQNQQLPSFRHNQQQQEQEPQGYDQHYRGFDYERSSPYNAFPNQQNTRRRRDPSDETQ